jgi:type III pantothenate kinase
VTLDLLRAKEENLRLELDAGNTRIKWRLIAADDSTLKSGSDLRVDIFSAEQPSWLARVTLVWVSSVHSDQSQWIVKKFPVAEFAIAQHEMFGFKNSYVSPAKMGVDRWLAMLAAWSAEPSRQHIVIDAGTAITMDIINTNGQHLGGYICPGFNMMKSTLLSDTNKVLAEKSWSQGRGLGRSTQHCVDHGIQDMVLSWVERHCHAMPEARIWVSGGDGVMLSNYLTCKHTYSADLVLDGLAKSFNHMVSN